MAMAMFTQPHLLFHRQPGRRTQQLARQGYKVSAARYLPARHLHAGQTCNSNLPADSLLLCHFGLCSMKGMTCNQAQHDLGPEVAAGAARGVTVTTTEANSRTGQAMAAGMAAQQATRHAGRQRARATSGTLTKLTNVFIVIQHCVC